MQITNIRYNDDCETYRIFGGETVEFGLRHNDWVEIIDVEGDQPCSVMAFNLQGDSVLDSMIWNNDANISITTVPNSLKTNLKNDHNPLIDILQKHKINSENLAAVNIFSPKASADTRQSFNFHQLTKQSVTCVFSADGGPMVVDSQNSPTEILINVTRANPKDTSEQLPEPLAKAVQDLRINHSSAISYTVKAGEYIQIIDIAGQQCSDFQAFPLTTVGQKQETCIDSTVTRTQIGSSYPAPGVFSKFYDQNSEPLLEIVRDMVCRHDTFGLACNAKYYDDRGFPWHINCTDNINNALAPHNISPRNNWTAVNFFFNTNIEESHTVSSDTSWSRAGDYVLLKAITDLVCVSTACPDDTSPVNNWNPTDIQIRIYDKTNNFSPAISFRPDPTTIPTMTKETGFHKNTTQLTRNFIEYNGYWLAADYNNLGAIKEYWQCREGVVMIDLSPLRKFEIYGPDAETLMQYAVTKDVRKLAIGQIVYSAMCYGNGCMLDDGTLYRLCDNIFRWIGGSDEGGKHLRRIAKDKNLNVWVKSSTDQLHNVAVQGPKSREVLAKIIWTPNTQTTLKELKWFRLTIGRIGGEFGIPVMVSRTGYSGELGYEVFAHPNDCAAVWEAINKAGSEFNICPLGLNALDMLRIEAGLIFAGYEFCDQTDPFEAGIAFTVPLKTKTDDFSGKENLIARKNSPQRVLAGLHLAQNEVAEHGDGVYIGRQQIGVITSATRSPILKKNIALCRISTKYAELDTKVEVGKLDGHHKRLMAKIVRFPFYDPEKTRVRM